jgi:hypothetical protein
MPCLSAGSLIPHGSFLGEHLCCNRLLIWHFDLLHSLELTSLRREIQEGLNVIENWNGANSFTSTAKAVRSLPTTFLPAKSFLIHH